MSKVISCFLSVWLLAASASAQQAVTAGPEERAEILVRLVSSLEDTSTRVDVVLVRGDVRVDIVNVTGIRADGPVLILDYKEEGSPGTLRAICDQADVLAVMEHRD